MQQGHLLSSTMYFHQNALFFKHQNTQTNQPLTETSEIWDISSCK